MFRFNHLYIFNNTLKNSDVFRCMCIKTTNKIQNEFSQNVKKSFGQPTFETHPHIIFNKNEVTPMINLSEFQDRRQRLVDNIIEHSIDHSIDVKEHIIVVPSATKLYMSDKIPYVFRQNSDFLYLSGCQEPDSCLILTVSKDAPTQHKSTIFMRDKDSHSELWDGPRTGPDQALDYFGVDQSLPVQELTNYMNGFLKSSNTSALWYDFINPLQPSVNKIMRDYMTEVPKKVWDKPTNFIHKLRLIKSQGEIALMQKSCNIASDAIVKSIKASKPGISEHQIFATVEYECKMAGAEYLAYPPVIAGGDRATTIHYINNNQLVHSGDTVLMDAGCEYHGYSSDITRTWPINGTFSPQQRALYEAVLTTQLELIDMLRDFPSLDKLFESMCALLGKRLQEIGLIPKTAYGDNVLKAAFEFCPHHVSHYLGMDVHDTPSIHRNIPLRPGMIVTVEPGVYINNKHKVPKEFQGLGIRIEDDVLITENGPVVLTKNCPKAIENIELIAALC